MRKTNRILIGLLVLWTLGCGRSAPPETAPDTSKSNAEITPDMLMLDFVDSTGKPVDLHKYLNKKNVLLVFTRGYPGYICPYCSGQVARLSKNYEEFKKRDTEVAVVFPGPAEHVDEFIRSAAKTTESDKLPFPILLDKDFKAVEKLHIRGDLAKPSTFLLDKQGRIRYAYVGATFTDRPSIDDMVKQLDAINAK